MAYLLPQISPVRGTGIQYIPRVRTGAKTRGTFSASARKNADIDWEDPEEEILLNRADLMELKFRRLIGEPPELRLAKVVAKKLNPHLYNLEIDKLVNKKGIQTYLRLIPEPAREAAYKDIVDEKEQKEVIKIEDDIGSIALAPRPRPASNPTDSPRDEENNEDFDHEDDEDSPGEQEAGEEDGENGGDGGEEFMSLATAARIDKMNRNEGYSSLRPRKKYDRRPGNIGGEARRALQMVERKIKWRK